MSDNLLAPLRDVVGVIGIFNNGEARLTKDHGIYRLDVLSADRRAHWTAAGLGGDGNV